MMINLAALAAAERDWNLTAHTTATGDITTRDADATEMTWPHAEVAFEAMTSNDARIAAHAIVAAQHFVDLAFGNPQPTTKPAACNVHNPTKRPLPGPPKKRPTVQTRQCWCHSADGGWKRMLDTQEDAFDVALMMSSKNGAAFTPFACPSGLGWHVASSIESKRAKAHLAAA